MNKKQVWQGNEAMSEAALRAGCTFYAGYPITPQSSITEYLSWRIGEIGGEFVQAESEVAAVNMLVGASAAGVRNMTATSGPGFSLMAEGMSVLAAGSMPSVIVDVQRSGAGGGNIIASQSDYNYATKSLGHGGLRGYVVGPSYVQELVDEVYNAFDFADKYKTLVIVMSDGLIGQMMEPVVIPEFIKEIPDRSASVPSGCKGREKMIVREFDFDTEVLEQRYIRLNDMYEYWQEHEVRVEEIQTADADYIFAAWGTTARICMTVMENLREQGYKVGMIRPITLHPFPYKSFEKLSAEKVKGVMTVEMSMPAQFYHDVKVGLDSEIQHEWFSRSAGNIITPEEIEEAFLKVFNGGC
jgi:2-oxoglutarate ferredoxin oxidoreductase subunit alpha